MRALHAVFGLIVLAACYTLFRQLLPRRWAFFASCLVGFSHAFFMISRLAMRENTAVLAEAVGLALLLRGLRHDHAFSTYCGGIVAGLGFYVYHPGRATFPLWVVFLVVLAVLYRDRYPLRQLARLGSIAAVGFVLMATPVVIAESKAPHSVGEAAPRAQLLIYPEGRELQKNWVFADSVWEGFKINVSFGLTTFNSDVVDHGWIYVNPGHGFVDPLTGILVWIGVAALALRFLRRRRLEDPLPLLMLGSFIVLWLSFAFIVNEAPKYPRLLITLPFVAYLVTESVRLLGRLLERGMARRSPARARRAGAAVAAGVLIAIAGGNLAIAWDFIDKGRKDGEPIGDTGRYIAAHPEEQIFLVADENGAYKYFPWGHPEWWASWMSWFSPDAKLQATVESNGVDTVQAQGPFALLMSRALLTQSESGLRDAYPTGRIRNITPDGKLVVLEVPRST
jgi:4-amino-4-deoxy-L-arabinose transferase-like glycosyltransferase